MLAKETIDKIVLTMSAMADRGITEFTSKQLIAETGFHRTTILGFTTGFRGEHIGIAKQGLPGRGNQASTYKWIQFGTKREPVKAKPKSGSRAALAEKWSNLSVPPEIASLGKFGAVGNVYNW